MPSNSLTARATRRTWIVSPGWDLAYLVLTPLAIVPLVALLIRRWLSPEQVYLAVISFASVGHHLPGFMRAYGDRELFNRFRWRFLLAPPLVFALALVFTPPPGVATALGLPWTHLHGLELILMLWGTWHGLMQTYGFMRIYDLRRGDEDRRAARLDQALCTSMFAAGIVFSDARMFEMAAAMWQSGLPLFGPSALYMSRVAMGVAGGVVVAAYLGYALSRQRRGTGVNWVKLSLAAVTGWFWWYCGRLSTNLLVGVAMFEIYHAVQYNAFVWAYNRRLCDRAPDRFGPLGLLFRDRLAMLCTYLGLIAAYSSIRYFTVQSGDRMYSGDMAGAHQWLIAVFVTSTVLHFYYDGFIWKVSERGTRENLVDETPNASSAVRLVPALVHAAKWVALGAMIGALLISERRYQAADGVAAKRQAAERAALSVLTPNVPEAQLLASHEALARGETESAATLAQQAAQGQPESHHHQAELAWAQMEVGNFDEARRALERAVELDNENWMYRCDLGYVLQQLGDFDEAEAQFRSAAKLAPKEAEPWERLADLQLRANRSADAVEFLNRAIALGSDAAATHYQLGLAFLHQGDAGRAVAPLMRAVKLDPEFFPGHLQLGDALLALAKPQAAVEPYQRAVMLRPDVVESRVALAEALLKSGRLADAETTLREGLAAQPQSAELNFTLGTVLQATGRVEQGKQLVERARSLGLGSGSE